MTDPFAGNVRPTSLTTSASPTSPPSLTTSLDDRRRRPRRSHHDEHQVTVVDGPLAGQHFGCALREVNADAACLLVRAELRVGQRVSVRTLLDGLPVGTPENGEVIRSRLLTTGRYEVMVEYRRPPAAPKQSESQRRHERRQARIARITQQPVNRSIDA